MRGNRAHQVSRGNVFADLGTPDAAMHAVKAALVARIQAVLDSRALTETEATEATGGNLRHILRGQFRAVSLEQLLIYLTRLGCEVDIVVKPANKKAFAPIHLEAEGV